jgi:hypothetical protein
MLFEQRWAPSIRSGEVTVTFRRWKRRQVVPGRRYRTPVGLIDVVAVDVVDPASIDRRDVALAGYQGLDSLLADLRGEERAALHRVEFRYADEPDPREERAADARVSDDDVETIRTRLARLDRASVEGPWTTRVLDLIEAHPGVRAGDLAEMDSVDRLVFKARVRRLKALSLTVSLPVGYRLSARGAAYRRHPGTAR